MGELTHQKQGPRATPHYVAVFAGVGGWGGRRDMRAGGRLPVTGGTDVSLAMDDQGN